MLGSGYSVKADGFAVVAESESRLQFEPRGEMVEFRSRIRDALELLWLEPGEHLLVEYTPRGDVADGWVDLENVALYNVGMSRFSRLLENGVSCRRLAPAGERHRVEYRKESGWSLSGNDAPPVARLEGQLTKLPNSPAAWWRSFRRMEFDVDRRLGEGDTFSLGVVVSGTGTTGWLASCLKAMLDGLIAAFSAHNGADRMLLEPLLDAALGEQNWDLLTDGRQAALPVRRLIRPHGKNMAWNPADELCSRFDVRLEDGPLAVSVELFADGPAQP